MACSRKVFWTALACFREQRARRSPSQIPIQEQADVLLLTEANRKDVGFVDSFTLDPGLHCGAGLWLHRLRPVQPAGRLAGVKLRHRLKGNAPYQLPNDCEIPENRGILADIGSFRLTGTAREAIACADRSRRLPTRFDGCCADSVVAGSAHQFCRGQNRCLNGVKPVKSRLF